MQNVYHLALPHIEVIGNINFSILNLAFINMDLVDEDFDNAFKFCDGAEQLEVESPDIFSNKSIAFMDFQ